MNQLLVDFEFLKIQVLRHLNGRKWQVKVASNVWNVSYLIRLALNSYSIRVALEECCRRVSRSQVTQLEPVWAVHLCAGASQRFQFQKKKHWLGPKKKKKTKKKTSTAVKKALESWTDSGSPTLSTRQESTKRMCSTTGTWRTREKKKRRKCFRFLASWRQCATADTLRCHCNDKSADCHGRNPRPCYAAGSRSALIDQRPLDVFQTIGTGHGTLLFV